MKHNFGAGLYPKHNLSAHAGREVTKINWDQAAGYYRYDLYCVVGNFTCRHEEVMCRVKFQSHNDI